MLHQSNPSYSTVFNEAFSRYVEQFGRPGYQPTLFTFFRHSKEKYPDLELFENELLNAPLDQQHKVIKAWLQNPKLKNNNHSFRTYLLDTLIERLPDEHWDDYDDKKIVFHHPDSTSEDCPIYLYRGSLQTPEEAFKKGMVSISRSSDIEDYTAVVNESCGVSTSKSARVANLYSTQIRTDHYGVHEFFGYVYQIHYRGNEGVDIDKTHGVRTLRTPTTNSKQEVNIITRIPPEDVVGSGYVNDNGQYIQTTANPNYEPDKLLRPLKDKAALLDQVFNQEDRRASCTIF